MNNKDMEAFESWLNDNWNPKTDPVVRCAQSAWEAACEYKQKEIDNYKALFEEEHNFRVEEFNYYKKLQAENAKLRECVQKVAYSYDRPTDMMNSARQVLKELDKK